MTIDEAIERAEERMNYNQKVVDTHIIVDNLTLDEILCDDTEIIEKHLAHYKKSANDCRQLAEWLEDYKILLEQEPCDDCVSRKQALIGIHNLYPGIPFTRQNVKKWKEENKKYFECENVIRALPSVAPKTNWIPVSERLPDDEQMVLVCSNNGNIEVSCGSRSTEIKEKFIWYTSGWKFGEVIAWRPLPKPYEVEMESEQSLNYADQDTMTPAT